MDCTAELAVNGEIMGWQSLSENTAGLESFGHSKLSPSLTSDGELHVLHFGMKFISELLSFAISAVFSSVRARNLFMAMTTVQSQFS